MPRKSTAPNASQVLQNQMNGGDGLSPQAPQNLGAAMGRGAIGDETEAPTVDSLRISDLEQQIAALTLMIRSQGAAQEGGKKLPKVRQFRAGIAFIDDEFPVVAFGKVKTKKVNGEEQMKFTVGVLKGENIVNQEVDYMPFMNETPRYQALIVSQSKKDIDTHQGTQPVRHITSNPDPLKITDDSKDFSAREIILEHTYQVITCVVKMLEGPLKGKELTLAAEALNR